MKRMITLTYHKNTRHEYDIIYTFTLDVDGRTEKMEYRTHKMYKEVLRDAYKKFEGANRIWIIKFDKFMYEA